MFFGANTYEVVRNTGYLTLLHMDVNVLINYTEPTILPKVKGICNWSGKFTLSSSLPYPLEGACIRYFKSHIFLFFFSCKY